MVITVFGATGQVGKRVVKYALAKRYTVRAFGRNVTNFIDEDLRNENFVAIQGSVFQAEDVFNAVDGADVVLSTLGGGFDGTDKTRSLGIKIIAAQMQKAGVSRIIALGGSGILSAADGTYIIDKPTYPKEYLPVGKEHLQAYLNLKNTDLQWTFIGAPDIKDEDATEQYIVSDTYPPHPNKMYVTAGDIADFMIREALNNEHVKQRVGISAK